MDMVILTMSIDNIALVDDLSSFQSTVISDDVTQNYVVISGGRSGSKWDVTFVRQVNTNDASDIILDDSPKYLVLAYNENTDIYTYPTGMHTTYFRLQDQ